MFEKLYKIFGMQGVHYLATRFGGSRIRGLAFDQKYSDGSWLKLDEKSDPEIVELVEKYAKKGRILDVGCGPGVLSTSLNRESFTHYLGVDISEEALALAKKREDERITFRHGDIEVFESEEKFDLIIFEETLYYLPFSHKKILERYTRMLKSDGLFLVTFIEPKRHTKIIEMIQSDFSVREETNSLISSRLFLIFR